MSKLTLSINNKLSAISLLCKIADVKESLYNKATEQYENNYENPDFEFAYDEAYSSYYNTCKSIAELLFDICTEKIDKSTALTIAFDKRAEIENFI